MKDALTAAYLAEAARLESNLATLTANSSRLTQLFENAGQPLLNRPLFVPRSKAEQFAADTAAIFDILLSLPERLFAGNIAKFCSALGISPRAASLMQRMPRIFPPLYGRADMYDDGERFHLLEFNLGSELGGIERAGEVPKAFLNDPDFAAFARRHQLETTDTGACVAAALRQAGAEIGAPHPVVALIDAPGSLAAYGAHWNSLRQVMQGHGLTFVIGEVNGLGFEQGKPVVEGQRADVVLRCFSVGEIVAEPDGEWVIEPLMQANDAGTVAVWTPMSSTLFANKGCLALLHEPEYRTGFTEAEKTLIARAIPRTHSLRGARVETLLATCRKDRENLILKPNDSYGGQGITAGWAVTDAAWEAALAAAAGKGWIVQQRIRPRPEPMLDGTQAEAAWGMYFTPAGPAGLYARVLPAGAPLIGLGADRRTRTAGAFTYPVST